MKKSKPETHPVMDYRQYRRARRLVHECCNYDGGNCIALDDGEECVCVQSISYSLLCRWFRAAVLPLDKELETALFHRPGRQAVRRLRGAVHPRLQPGQILPGMCAESPPAAKGRVRTPKEGTAWTIRGQKTPCKSRLFFEGVAGGLIDLSSGPQNGPLKAYRPLK